LAGDLLFRIEEWDAEALHVTELLAEASHLAVAKAAFVAAKLIRPDRYLTLRHGARVIDTVDPDADEGWPGADRLGPAQRAALVFHVKNHDAAFSASAIW
jgi:hypothetical protein